VIAEKQAPEPSQTTPSWFDVDFAIAVHGEQLRDHGGKTGIRDRTLLESALYRAQQLSIYGSPDCFDLAAAYAFGIAKNHPFLDGNKRTAWVLARAFCLLAGFDYSGNDADAVLAMLRLAAGDDNQEIFAAFLREHAIADG
jgi:death on curing protein